MKNIKRIKAELEKMSYGKDEVVNGERIRVYDSGEKDFDRYTVVYLDSFNPNEPDLYECFGLSENPFHPQGFGQHSECQIGSHLGKIIPFNSLPKDCQDAVMQDVS